MTSLSHGDGIESDETKFHGIFATETAANNHGRGSQVLGVPGNFYSSSTCLPTYAIPYATPSTLLPAPLIPLRIPTDTGDRPYKCQHCGDQFARRSVPPNLPSPAAPLISIRSS